MSNRDRGDYLERQTRTALEGVGWVVVRAGGSLGPADLVAFRYGNTPLVIQCKILGPGRAFPRVDPDERERLWNTAQKGGARPIIATRYRGGMVALLALNGPSWTQYPLLDEIHVPARPGKKAVRHG